MTKDTRFSNPDAGERNTNKLRVVESESLPATLVDPFVAFADPLRPVERETPKARAVIDELPRRDVEELSRALDQATGVAESVVVTVKLSPREYRRLRDQAAASGDTEQIVLREALFEYLDRRGL